MTSGSGSATGYTLRTYASSTAENVLALTTPITTPISGAMSGADGFTWNSAGTLSPGNSIESLATGTATFAAGATFAYEVDSTDVGVLSTAADLLVVSGNLTLDPGNGSLLSFLDLNGTPNPFVEDTTVFAMINYTGTWNGGLFSYNGNVLSDGERFTVGGQQWQIDYDYAYDTANPTTIQPVNYQGDYQPASGTQLFVAVTAVPEPSTIVLAAVGAALASIAVRRRRTG